MRDIANPPPPQPRLSVGVTGHRVGHPSYIGNAQAVTQALELAFSTIDHALDRQSSGANVSGQMPVRLHTLLANGTDQVAAKLALARGWELVAPMPFGRRVNEAINATPQSSGDASRLLQGEEPEDPMVAQQAAAIRALADQAHIFELAEQDDAIAELLIRHLDQPHDNIATQHFSGETALRVAQAAQIMIEQSDIVLGVWDGVSTAHVGGTGHTVAAALAVGVPVLWINPSCPGDWRVLRAPEALASLSDGGDGTSAVLLEELVADAVRPDGGQSAHATSMSQEQWHPASNRLAHAYRRIEALFGGRTWSERLGSVRQYYAAPDAIGAEREDIGDGQAQAALSISEGQDPGFADRIANAVTRRFRWADGVSARLSDAYRGGMIVNFILSSLAIVGGVAYLPLVGPSGKWGFALFELTLLCVILIITGVGQKRRWHGRWFQTRRLAEYLRHAPLMLMLGVARAPGRWPRGADTSWPEFQARQAMREVGLPRAVVTASWLRAILSHQLKSHVVSQRDYHEGKARRLAAVHHNLDKMSNALFSAAVVSVAIYLILRGLAGLDFISVEPVDHGSKIFTLLGVLLPTFGAGIAGIRYFGDFERFAAISEVTAAKLSSIQARIELLEHAPDSALSYHHVAEIAHATDDIVFAEIENWQAVFGGKHMTVPV